MGGMGAAAPVAPVAPVTPVVPVCPVLPVAPVLQVIVPEQFDAVNFAASVPHKLVLSATTVGAVGLPPVVIVSAFELPLVPQLFPAVTVMSPP